MYSISEQINVSLRFLFNFLSLFPSRLILEVFYSDAYFDISFWNWSFLTATFDFPGIDPVIICQKHNFYFILHKKKIKAEIREV